MKGNLLDENLPDRLRIQLPLPVVHSAALGLSLSDETLWDYAREHGLAIITKDTDFTERAMLSIPPPWVVHLRIGNMRKEAFHQFIARHLPQALALLPACKLVYVYLDRIESIA